MTTPITNALPQRIFSTDRAECRQCGAHVRLRYRDASSAAAWCAVCCTSSDYHIEPRPLAA